MQAEERGDRQVSGNHDGELRWRGLRFVSRWMMDRDARLYDVQSLSNAATGHPNLNLTDEEKRVYGQLFKIADPDGFQVVSGDVAVKFFERTKLPPDVLGQVGIQ